MNPTYNEKCKKEGRQIMDRQNTKWSEEIAGKCDHEWQPVSFRFETQLLDNSGRVQIRQPDLANGRVYCVCMKCCSHTYIETGYVGYYINSPDLLEDNDNAE
jgi:hypothetical protein